MKGNQIMPRKRKTSSPAIGVELLQATFSVTNKQKTFHTPEVDRIMDEATLLLRAKKGAQAEHLFRRAITLEPLQPDLLNNLATSLTLQGREAEGMRLIETVHILFPDYLFARTSLATIAMRAGNYEQASKLLAPLFSRREFHVSEFNALCPALIEFSIFTKHYHSARIWFETWSNPDPKNPKLDFYRDLLQKAGA
ncbi:MAG: tetratricopeptide repeat protein [Chloroflexota bacterium]